MLHNVLKVTFASHINIPQIQSSLYLYEIAFKNMNVDILILIEDLKSNSCDLESRAGIFLFR